MRLTNILLTTTVVVLGLSAGFFVTYQISVMPGLARTDDVVFVQSMQGINAAVRSAPFALIFFGPLPLLVASAVALARQRAIAALLLAAALLYGFGLLGVTFAGNVPLNEMLATRLDPADATAARAAYEEPWNRLNAIRTRCVLAAFVVVAATAIWLPRPTETRPIRTRTPVGDPGELHHGGAAAGDARVRVGPPAGRGPVLRPPPSGHRSMPVQRWRRTGHRVRATA
jgi:uncharacterized membrane protein